MVLNLQLLHLELVFLNELVKLLLECFPGLLSFLCLESESDVFLSDPLEILDDHRHFLGVLLELQSLLLEVSQIFVLLNNLLIFLKDNIFQVAVFFDDQSLELFIFGHLFLQTISLVVDSFQEILL